MKEGDLYKHFKGKTLEEKNIYRILETNVTYSESATNVPLTNLIIYKNVFDGKIFARELDDLICEVSKEKQELYGQKHRIERLTEDEIKWVHNKLNS